MKNALTKALKEAKLKAPDGPDLYQLGVDQSAISGVASTASQDAAPTMNGQVEASLAAPSDVPSTAGQTVTDGATPTSPPGVTHPSAQGVISLTTQNVPPLKIKDESPPAAQDKSPAETSDAKFATTQGAGILAGILATNDTDPSATKSIVKNKTPKFTVKKKADESDIENAEPLTILLFGNGFQMKVVNEKTKYFQQRYCLGKNSTRNLGKYPDMDFAQALEEAEKCRAEVQMVRQKRRATAFTARLKKPMPKSKRDSYSESDKYLTFQSMEDAGQFLRNLVDNKNGIHEEILFAIHLLLLIPSRPNDLLEAQWNNMFHPNSPRWANVDQWTIKAGRTTPNNNKWIPPQIAYLSKKAMTLIHELRTKRLPGSDDSQLPIFPNLFKMEKTIRANELAQALKKIWPLYTIELDGFRYFFETMAYKNSCFKPEIIDALMAHKAQSVNDYRSYIQYMHAIADWWGDELVWYTSGNSQYQAGRL